MKTELLGQEKNVVKIKVQFEAAEFDKGLKQALKALSQEINVPGFRKGHAPRSVIEMRIGRDALYNEVFERLFAKQLPQIYEDYELDPIESPSMTPDEVHEGSDVTCTLEVEVMPEIELPDLAEIEVEKLKISISDNDVINVEEDIKRRFAKVSPSDKPAGENDVLSVTLSTNIVDETEGGQGPSKTIIDLADVSVRSDIRSSLIGHSAGETVETEFDVEADYQDKTVAGKRIHYTILVESVGEREMPELNADFFKKLYGDAAEIADETAWREKLRADVTSQAEDEAKSAASSRALDIIAGKAKFDLPDSMLRRQVAALRENDEKEAKERFNSTLKDVLSDGKEDWEKGYMQLLMLRAQGIVRRSLVLGAIADRNNITVEQEDIDREMERRASVFGVDKKRVASMFYKDRDAFTQLAERIRLDKATDLMMSKVRIKEVDQLTPAASGGEDAGA